jgi:hypothetical protein
VKKYIALAVSMIFVLGFAASAFAIHAEIPSETTATVAKGSTQITLGGEIRVRGEMRDNTNTLNSDAADSTGFYDQRVRLSVEAKVSPNTLGYVMLETSNADTSDVFNWGSMESPAANQIGAGLATALDANNANGKGLYPRGNSKRGDMRILEAYILHKGSGLLGMPAGLKIGHMALKLGNGLFYDHTKFGDDAIVVFVDPTKELHLGLVTVKAAEGVTTKNDDANFYVGVINYTTKDLSIHSDLTYVNEQAFGIYTNTSVVPADRGTGLWNLGIHAKANVSGLGIMADVELQTGKSKGETTNLFGVPLAVTGDIKQSGMAALLGLSYKLDPVTLSLEGAYGSGDDDATDTKNKAFVNALGADQHYTLVYDYRVKTAAGAVQTGLSNTTYVKLGGSANLTKDITADLNAYWLRATKAVALMGATNDDGTANTSKALGAEVDAKVSYKMDKNLMYWVEGGYLFAGKAYDQGNAALSTAKSSDNAYVVRHGIQLNF